MCYMFCLFYSSPIVIRQWWIGILSRKLMQMKNRDWVTIDVDKLYFKPRYLKCSLYEQLT